MYTCLYFLEGQFGNLSNFKHSSYSPRHFSWRCIILAAFILVAQSCPTLRNPMDYSPPGSPVHGILQARILKWVAIPFSKASFWPRDWTWFSCVAGRFFTFWATREAHDKARQHIKKQRHHFTSKGLYSQSYGFSGSITWMWKLGHKEGWAPKSWYFWAVELEKTLESPLDS